MLERILDVIIPVLLAIALVMLILWFILMLSTPSAHEICEANGGRLVDGGVQMVPIPTGKTIILMPTRVYQCILAGGSRRG